MSEEQTFCAPKTLSTCLLTLILGVLAVGPTVAQPGLEVDIQPGKVRIVARAISMKEILQEISEQTGLVLTLEEAEEEEIEILTLEVVDTSLRSALTQLLDGRNFMLQRSPSSSDGSSFQGPGPLKLWLFEADPERDRTVKHTEDIVADDDNDNDEEEDGAARNPLHEIQAFADDGGEEAKLALAAAALTDPDASVREEAIYGLGEIGHQAELAVLEQLLADPSRRIREAAIEAISDIGGEQSISVLAISLRDQDPDLREQTIFALGSVPGEFATSLLESALSDEHRIVRRAAAEALQERSE